jgi:hypothetical protein
MANTTNYNWETPDDTDLVKDGAAAIRTLGNSIDTTTKALNPETTLGDIAYRSATSNTNTRLPIGSNGQILGVSAGVPAWINNDQGDITEVQAGVGISIASGTGPIPVITNSSTDLITTAGDILYGTAADTVARLGIGTAGQVLKVNSGATAPEWAAASSGAFTLIARTSFTNVASQSFDNFSSTYNSYMVIIESIFNTNQNDANLRLTMRYGGTDGTAHYGQATTNGFNSNTWSSLNTPLNSNYVEISPDTGVAANPNIAVIYFMNGFVNASQDGQFFGTLINVNGPGQTIFSGVNASNQQYTGFKLASSTQNIDGTVAIYGLAKA